MAKVALNDYHYGYIKGIQFMVHVIAKNRFRVSMIDLATEEITGIKEKYGKPL